MDFFERQDKARRKTKLLVFYFIVAICLLILSGYAAVLAIFGRGGVSDSMGESSFTLWQPDLFLWSTLGTLSVILIGSVSKTLQLSKGGSAVAEMLDGRLINSNATEADERKLLNVVEEMSIASGIPVPQVYLLEDEAGINAFAAGHSTSDAAIGVTRGAMQLLSRDQLQGVIGHEFSHVLNGDMRLNLRLMGLIFGILCLTVVGRVLLRTRGKKNPLPLLGLALIVIGGIGVLFGRLIQAAVSRQREFLADAASVQFTRNPDGLAGALKKIGGLSSGSKLESPHAQEASHLFFANGLRSSVSGLMATHPPLEERIRALDPAFDGEFPTVTPEIAEPPINQFQQLTSQPPPIPPRTGSAASASAAPSSLLSRRKRFCRISAKSRRAICNTQPICSSPSRKRSNPPRAIRSARALSSTRSCSAPIHPRARSNSPSLPLELPLKFVTKRSASGLTLKAWRCRRRSRWSISRCRLCASFHPPNSSSSGPQFTLSSKATGRSISSNTCCKKLCSVISSRISFPPRNE